MMISLYLLCVLRMVPYTVRRLVRLGDNPRFREQRISGELRIPFPGSADFPFVDVQVSFNVCVDYKNRQTSESSEMYNLHHRLA